MDGDRTHLRDVSFSSYLSMVGENFSSGDQAPTPPPVPARGLETPRRAKTSEELGVFEAERYYNMGVAGYYQEESIKESARKVGYMKDDEVMAQTPNRRNKQQHNNFRTTPSVSSEGSSWNSQSALMLAYAKRSNKASTSNNSFFSGIGCYGRSCSDKDSVIIRKPVRKSEVCQNIDPKLIVFDGTKQRFHHHPKDVLRSPVSIASSSNISHRVLAPALNRIIKDEDVPRVSLEVFGSNKPADDHDHVLERKLSMLTWDAVPKSQSIKDEIESDASSDLFEIENISSQNEQRYEPSEASIEWSVATASAADFSGNDDKRVLETTAPRKGGGILGCKSYKAVRVVEPLPAPKSSYTAAVVGFTSHHHLRHNQSQLQ